MTKLLIRYLLIFTVFSCMQIQSAEAQSKKRLRELERTEQEQAAEKNAADEEAKKRHMEIQSKQTRKEMKKYKRKSKRLNKNKREPFYKRWFRRNKR